MDYRNCPVKVAVRGGRENALRFDRDGVTEDADILTVLPVSPNQLSGLGQINYSIQHQTWA